MSKHLIGWLLGLIVLNATLWGQAISTTQQIHTAFQLDLTKLEKVDVDAIVKNGLRSGQTDFATILAEADARIADIRSRKGYTPLDLDILTSPWVRTKEFIQLLQQGQPWPEIKLAVRAERNGVFDSGGTEVFKGQAQRAVQIMREIGLKDTANGRSWSDMWGIMERRATVLGKMPNGDLVVRVDVILGVNKFFEFVYMQIYNVRDIERYTEHDLGNGNYIIIQDMLADDSVGCAPRAPERRKRPAKQYCPIKEQISITLIHDNKDGTFTLGNFMSTHGQKLEAITDGAKFLSNFVDLQEEMKKDTIKNRKKWNELFQKEVLRTPEN